MKRFILPFLIIIVCPLAAAASEVGSMAAQRPDSIRVSDSLELFRNITDIGKQIERRTAKSVEVNPAGAASQEKKRVESISVELQQARDSSLRKPDVVPPDTILLDTVDVALPAERTVSMAPIDSTLLYRNPLDSVYERNADGLLLLPDNFSNFETMMGLTFSDTLFYNPLFLPMIFTGEMLPRKLLLYSPDENADAGKLIPREETFAPRLDHVDFVRSVRRDYYMKYPDRIRYSVASFDSIPGQEPDDRTVKENFNPFGDLIKTETAFSLATPDVKGVVIGRKYWICSGEHTLQFAQNYFSDNWHSGGTNNLNLNSVHIVKANYQRNKVKFNNTLEWRLSVYNSPDDSLRNYRIGNDLIRYYGDFGIDAFLKGWSYSTNLEAKSQLLKNYPINENSLQSSLISPLYVNAGLGLKYSLSKSSQKVRHRKVTWEVSIAPVSVNCTYVGNGAVDEVQYGIEEGKRMLLDLGSTLTSNLKYNITKYITWSSRFSYFTSYEKVISEFENTLNMALSNAFSTIIYVNMRFDDGVPADPKFKYFQMNQTLSFGLNYKW